MHCCLSVKYLKECNPTNGGGAGANIIAIPNNVSFRYVTIFSLDQLSKPPMLKVFKSSVNIVIWGLNG